VGRLGRSTQNPVCGTNQSRQSSAHLPELEIARHALQNGLRVTLSHDERVPIVAVNLWYAVGSGHEKVGKTGFAHLFEHLMMQGSANVAKGEHYALVEAAGGRTNASTSWDRTNYFERLPSHELELALWLESDRLGSLLPAMTQEKLDNQREVVKNERRFRVDNQPYGTSDEKLQALLFPEGHPYHHPIIGSMEDLDAASLADVAEFFAAYYAPNNAVLTIAGDFDPPAALRLVERYFGPISPNPAMASALPIVMDAPFEAAVIETVFDRVPLPRVYVACHTPVFGSADFDALQVAMDLLGAGRASRLYRSLVREQQLAQEVETYAFPALGGAAVFAMSVTARHGVRRETLEDALWAEVDRLTAEGPTQDELERARNLYAAGIESSLERLGERADRLSMHTCLFDDPERINTEVPRYFAVDGGRVRDAIITGLQPDHRVVLTYLPAESHQRGRS
jgi:zinc protease